MLGNPAWLLAIATIVASVGITVVFRHLMSRMFELMEADEAEVDKRLQREVTSFFLKVLIIEIVPIILTIVGIIYLQRFSGTIDEMILPMAVIGGFYILSLLIIYISAKQVQNNVKISPKINHHVSTFMMIGIATSSTFPLISFVMIYLLAS